MEARLVHHTPATLTVPSQPVSTVLRPRLLQHYADGVCEPDGVVRRVGGQEEHLAFVDVDVAELVVVDDFQQHAAFVLVEPFGRFVDVVVCSRVGSADDLLKGGRGTFSYIDRGVVRRVWGTDDRTMTVTSLL